MPEEAEVQGTEAKQYDETYVKELRGEAAGYRVERNDFKKQVEALADELKGFKDKGKSEVEKLAEEKATLQQRITDMETAAQVGEIKAKVVSEASKLNVVDIEAAYKLLDLSLIDTDPKSVTVALKALIKEKPYLIKSSAPPTPGVGGRPIVGKKAPAEQFAEMLRQGAKKH